MHNIIIKRVTNGVIVTIGCHTFVHNNITFVLQEIGDYLKNPATTMKRWEPTLKSWYKIQEESEDTPSLEQAQKGYEANRLAAGRLHIRPEFQEEAKRLPNLPRPDLAGRNSILHQREAISHADDLL
jgi:hypothetical protein